MCDSLIRTSVIRQTVLLTVAILVFVASATYAQGGIDRAATARGAETFRIYCSSCHGRQATGDGPLAKDLRTPPANLTELGSADGGEFPHDLVLSAIELWRNVSGHGSQDMPAWGDAFNRATESEAEARNKVEELVEYLRSIQK